MSAPVYSGRAKKGERRCGHQPRCSASVLRLWSCRSATAPMPRRQTLHPRSWICRYPPAAGPSRCSSSPHRSREPPSFCSAAAAACWRSTMPAMSGRATTSSCGRAARGPHAGVCRPVAGAAKRRLAARNAAHARLPRGARRGHRLCPLAGQRAGLAYRDESGLDRGGQWCGASGAQGRRSGTDLVGHPDRPCRRNRVRRRSRCDCGAGAGRQ